MTSEEIRDTDIVVLLLGPSGSGKTSFINTAAGIDEGVGHGLKSFTNEIDVVRVRVPYDSQTIDVILVDTPGFDSTHRSDHRTLELISDWLKHTKESAWHILERFAGAPKQGLPGLQLQKKMVDYRGSHPPDIESNLISLDQQCKSLMHTSPQHMSRQGMDHSNSKVVPFPFPQNASHSTSKVLTDETQ
ncbi:hypothetical protein P691DRAFT_802575 [Macrolepiota fuliginosa MF-IS2]|uniref:G domain-containing protein n=1 Tax=Macrolepiota fuliginosa MF-IS2 TaxID=1400762 RepID=A0A9P5XCJ1_9AGAR|nr:hypothetical protein P691DRAFT_802575 [Macrolepiota fuliginosa MF-IS2]